MSETEKGNPIKTTLARCPGALALIVVALALGCGEPETMFVLPLGGSGGAAGSSGTGGAAGTGGMGGVGGAGGSAGTGGEAGTGGTSGTAGSGGSAGTGGSSGTGGTGGAVGACVTSALCDTCPSEVFDDRFLCDAATGAGCAFSGYECVPSGCTTHGGTPLGQCQELASPSCNTDADCPNPGDYDCVQVGGGGSRCQRVATGCNPATQTFDCAPGFSCEGGACVDRRLPCDDTTDCPKSHICHVAIGTGSFCHSVHRSCRVKGDCRWEGGILGEGCVDIDDDGRTECTGELTTTGLACVNTMCPASDPICENGVFGNGDTAVCGDYGLCDTDADCGSGFDCVGLWQDGRKECVPDSGPSDNCVSAPTDCPLQQVCASPREGGRPSCQAGK